MGDRTSVYLDIRKSDKERVEAIIEEHYGDCDDIFEGECLSDHVQTIQYSFYDVNYANLHIENILQENKIPYNKCWGEGCEYPAGSEIFRIDVDGEAIIKEFNANTEGMVALDDVIKALGLNRVDQFVEEMKQEITVISWEEQENILLVQSNNKIAYKELCESDKVEEKASYNHHRHHVV